MRISAYFRVLTHFGSAAKADEWFKTNNPLLGGVSPVEMIDMGREEKLMKFIDDQLGEKEEPHE